MIQLLPGIRIKVPNKHSTYGRVKVKTIQLISGKHKTLGKRRLLHVTCYIKHFLISQLKLRGAAAGKTLAM